MDLLGVLCLFGVTVALPVLPEPPKLPYSIAAAHQNQEFHMNTPKEYAAYSSLRNNNKVNKDVTNLYTVSIPPPPELPPFDYTRFMKQIAQKARDNGSVESQVESLFEIKDSKPTEEPVETVENKLKPIENSKFQEEVQPIEESKFEEVPTPIAEPSYIEEPKLTEEPVTIKESTYVGKPTSLEEPKPAENLDTSKVENKEEPEKALEDIPVVIQFTIPTTSFLSGIFSKFPSLPSFGFSWPFHLPSIFSRPRIDPNYIDDEIYPY